MLSILKIEDNCLTCSRSVFRSTTLYKNDLRSKPLVTDDGIKPLFRGIWLDWGGNTGFLKGCNGNGYNETVLTILQYYLKLVLIKFTKLVIVFYKTTKFTKFYKTTELCFTKLIKLLNFTKFTTLVILKINLLFYAQIFSFFLIK